MSAENNDRVIRNLIELLHKDRTAITQIVHDCFVVHHFVTNVNGLSEDLKRAINDVDSAINTSTKSARVGKHHCHQCNSAGSTRSIFTSNLRVRPASGWLKLTRTVSSSKESTTPGTSPPAASAKLNTMPTSSSESLLNV